VPVHPFLSRRERFAIVGSTNDVVRDWLADGIPEVCVAVAAEQRAGRGREGRSWVAPSGAALLLSAGFRPTYLQADQVWRLAATVSLAMAEAAEEVAALPGRTIQLKWPNDLVTGTDDATRKLAGVLGETSGLGTDDPRAVVGIGVNVDWRAADFPAALRSAMTSLREVSGGQPVEVDALLTAFLAALEIRTEALRAGRFDAAEWTDRQATTGRLVLLERFDGSWRGARARGVDPVSGALLVEDPDAPGGERLIHSGEIRHLRLGDSTTSHATAATVEV